MMIQCMISLQRYLISAEHNKGAELSIENATSGVSVPFHPGAARYYAEHGIDAVIQE